MICKSLIFSFVFCFLFFLSLLQLSESTSAVMWCTNKEHAQSLVSMTDPEAVLDAINFAFVRIMEGGRRKGGRKREREREGGRGDKTKPEVVVTFHIPHSLTHFPKVISLHLSPRLYGTQWEYSAMKLHPLTGCHPWPVPCWSQAGTLLH